MLLIFSIKNFVNLLAKNIFWCFNIIVIFVLTIYYPGELKLSMKKNIFFKLFTFTFIFILSSLTVSANDINYLKRLIIEPINNNEYNVNFLFDNNYAGKAFLQKNGNNGYYIFLPDSTYSKKVKINYVHLSDKRNIQFNIATKPIIKNNVESKYIKLDVFMNDNYKIKLTSGLNSDYHPFIIALKNISIYTFIVLLILAGICFMLFRLLKGFFNNTETNSYTSFPVNFDSAYKIPSAPQDTKNYKRAIIPRNIIKNSLSESEKNSFGCFNIESIAKLNNKSYEIKSSLNQTSNLLNDTSNVVKLKHTNPITKTEHIEESELSMPLVDDVLPPPHEIKEEKESDKSDILSILKLTPNKGFYLISEDNSFKLFGFVNKNIFPLETFKDLSQINLQARYYDNSGKNEIYIVRLDDYKAMIEISDSSMKELAKI